MWSWEVGTGLSQHTLGAVIVAATPGRWQQDHLASRHQVACAAVSESVPSLQRWTVSASLHSFSTAAKGCSPGYHFTPPQSHSDNSALLTSMRREGVPEAWVAASTQPVTTSAAGALHCPLLSVMGVVLLFVTVLASPTW